MMRILPFPLKKTDPLLQLCEDPLSTDHSVEIKTQETHLLRHCCDNTSEKYVILKNVNTSQEVIVTLIKCLSAK